MSPAPSAKKAITIVARMYSAHETARRILSDRFQSKMSEQIPLIKEVMAANRCEALPAAMALVHEIQKAEPHTQEGAMRQMFVLAAYVEMHEPSAHVQTTMRCFRSMVSRCLKCEAKNSFRSQVDPGIHQWECGNCGEKTAHQIDFEEDIAPTIKQS